jgi:hypothetical protein
MWNRQPLMSASDLETVCYATQRVLKALAEAPQCQIIEAYVKVRMPALDYVGLHTVIEWIMVAHVDSSDCRCRCISRISTKDLMLVAS